MTQNAKGGTRADHAILSNYFSEMSCFDVLDAHQELAAAQTIERLELALWETVLSFAPAIDVVCRRIFMVADTLADCDSLRELRSIAPALLGRAALPTRECGVGSIHRLTGESAGARRSRSVLRAARKFRAFDCDRVVITAVLGAIARMPRTPTNRAWLGRVDRAQRAAAVARHRFVTANLRLVVSIARRFNHGRMPLADLIQEGNLGLLKAVERYDYRRGFRFSTYATWWIRHAIGRAIADKARAIRLPVHLIDASHAVAKTRRQLTATLGREPTNDELAIATDMTVEKVELLRAWHIEQPIAIDKPTRDGDGLPLAELLEDPNSAASPLAELIREASEADVRDLLGQLTPIEADILRHRFGFVSEELTLQEIGARVSLSRERVRQLQEQALGKMRRALTRTEVPPNVAVAPRPET